MADSFLDGRVTLHRGDCLAILPTLAENSVDAVVTDPPYHLTSIVRRFGSDNAAPAKSNGITGVYARASSGFMGKVWDGGEIAFDPSTWAAVLRVLKPGGHLLAFAAPRNSHRMVCAIEDAGFEIRDGLMWMFGSGFPKSHDVSKGIDRAAGAEREVIGIKAAGMGSGKTFGMLQAEGNNHEASREVRITAPATADARQWDGWGTALKPAYEPICLARKPLSEPSIAANVLRWSTGALNIKACRIGPPNDQSGSSADRSTGSHTSRHSGDGMSGLRSDVSSAEVSRCAQQDDDLREDLPREGDEQGGQLALEGRTVSRRGRIYSSADRERVSAGTSGGYGGQTRPTAAIDGSHSPHQQRGSRQPAGEPKALPGAGNSHNGKPREALPANGQIDAPLGRWPANIITDGSDEVVSAFPETTSGRASGYNWDDSGNDNPTHVIKNIKSGIHFGDSGSASRFFYTAKADSHDRIGSRHPTVKPLDLMQYLARLVCPPNGTILDPFAGSGTTGEAAWREGFRAILVEREAEYQADIERRMRLCLSGTDERAREAIKARTKDKPTNHGPLFGGEAA